MKKTEKKIKKEPKVLLIACYRRRYTDESVQKIKKIVEKTEPDRIIILKIIQKKHKMEMVDANVGYGAREKVKQSIERLKKNDIDELGDQIIEMIDKMNIPYEVHLRAGDLISKEIVDMYENVNTVQLIIHSSPRDTIDKIIDPGTEDNVIKRLGEEKIIFLE